MRELSARRGAFSAVDAIALAREHDLPAWLAPAYAELVRRAMPLDDDEAERLGARTAGRVARAREALRAEACAQHRHQHRECGVSPELFDEGCVARVVDEAFQLAGPMYP